jgi:sortase A
MIVRLLWHKSQRTGWEKVRHAEQGFFLAGGCLALVYCGFAYFEAALYQASEISRLANIVPAANSPQTRKAMEVALRGGIREGSSFGRIDIPRIGVSSVMIEGVTPRNLRVAVGHIPGTALPGEPGNAVIAGHRDTFFRKLRELRKDDIIILSAVYGSYRYSVAAIRIVQPGNLAVMDYSTEPVLTLITCYPFYYVGPAPQRFVVRARQITGADLESIPAAVAVSVASPPPTRGPIADRLFGIRGWFEKPRPQR